MIQKDNILVGELVTYPDTVTMSSTGSASEKHHDIMGVYKITNMTRSGRPVWQSTVREDNYLFYNSIYWIVSTELSNNLAAIKSKKKGLILLPIRGWQYSIANNGLEDDTTLTVTGKNIIFLLEFHLFP